MFMMVLFCVSCHLSVITYNLKKTSQQWKLDLMTNNKSFVHEWKNCQTECFISCFVKFMMPFDMLLASANKSFWSCLFQKWHVCLKSNIMCQKCWGVKSPGWMDLCSHLVRTDQNTVIRTAAFSWKGKDVFLTTYLILPFACRILNVIWKVILSSS